MKKKDDRRKDKDSKLNENDIVGISPRSMYGNLPTPKKRKFYIPSLTSHSYNKTFRNGGERGVGVAEMEEGILKTGKKKGLNENRLVTTKKNLTRNDQESKPGARFSKDPVT